MDRVRLSGAHGERVCLSFRTHTRLCSRDDRWNARQARKAPLEDHSAKDSKVVTLGPAPTFDHHVPVLAISISSASTRVLTKDDDDGASRARDVPFSGMCCKGVRLASRPDSRINSQIAHSKKRALFPALLRSCESLMQSQTLGRLLQRGRSLDDGPY